MSPELDEKRRLLNMWLARENLSRKELAARLQVSEASVYNWLSCTNIPEKRWLEIKAMFEPNEEQSQPIEQFRAVGIGFSDEELLKLRKVAGDKPLDVYVRELTLKHVRQELGE